MERASLTADQYLCQAAEIERPAGWNRRRGARLCTAIRRSLDEGKTPEETHEIAMKSATGFVFAWILKTVLSNLIWWAIQKLMAGRATGAFRD